MNRFFLFVSLALLLPNAAQAQAGFPWAWCQSAGVPPISPIVYPPGFANMPHEKRKEINDQLMKANSLEVARYTAACLDTLHRAQEAERIRVAEEDERRRIANAKREENERVGANERSQTQGGAVVEDPYAKDYDKSLMERYVHDRTMFFSEVRYIYFGFGCKVVMNEVDILPLVNLLAKNLDRERIEMSIADPNAEMMMRKTVSEGMAKASRAGECDFWHKHPDAVFRLRKDAQDAMNISSSIAR
jgi:hypothetical protein